MILLIIGGSMQNEEGKVFVNNALDEGMQLFINNQNKENLDFNRFLCCIIRMMTLLYGEKEIIEAYHQNNEELFDSILMKYGFPKEELSNFKIVCDKFNHFDKRQQKKTIKKKNKYFNLVQKSLIDMLVKKMESNLVDEKEKNEFYQLLFTARSKNFYRKSTAVLLAYNPYEIDDYAKKKNLVGG